MAAHNTTAMMEASAPKFPPVRISGPLILGRMSEYILEWPDTANPKMVPWVKFHAQ